MRTRRLKVDLLPHQAEFKFCDLFNPVLVGGLGCGKTRGAIELAIKISSINPPDVPTGLVEPTYPMVRDILVPEMLEIFEEQGIKHKQNKANQNWLVHINGEWRQWKLRNSEESAERLKRKQGTQYGGLILDEFGQHGKDSYKVWSGRVRHKRAKIRQLGLVGTPEGYNHFYDITEEVKPWRKVIRARTLDNPYLEPSPEEYIRVQLSGYSANELRAYTNGLFVSSRGSVYTYYDEDRNCRTLASLADVGVADGWWIGADFNVNPMCWVFGRSIGGIDQVIGEMFNENTNTFEQTDAAGEWWREHLSEAFGRPVSYDTVRDSVKIYCDATGQARRTSAQQTDVDIMRSAGFTVLVEPSNPPIRDRVYAVQARLKTGELLVDPEMAPRTHKALMAQEYDKHGQPDKKAGFDHPVDAVGYKVYYTHPLQAPRGNLGI